jgi:hypothetical protein
MRAPHRDLILAEATRVGRLRQLQVSLYWSLASLHAAIQSGQDSAEAATWTQEHLASLITS